MKFGIFNNFGARNSVPVFDAFQQGLARLGFVSSPHDLSADVAVIWSTVWAGRMKANHAVWQEFRQSGRPVIVLEVGMLDREITWKLGIDGTGYGCYADTDLDPHRPEKLGIVPRPWRSQGDHILIAMQRTDSEQWKNMPTGEVWLQHTVDHIRQNTDRPIVIRNHPRQSVPVPTGCLHWQPKSIFNSYDSFDFENSISNAWAVINHNSGPGSQSIIAGIPAFVHCSSLSASVGNLSYDSINNPVMPDRSQWLIEVSHTEWTIPEIASGYPLERLIFRLA